MSKTTTTRANKAEIARAKKDAAKALNLVLTADKRIAGVYVRAITKAEGIMTNAERDFVKGFVTNHQGQDAKVIKTGFKKLRDSKAFGALGDQTVSNLSSMAQYVCTLDKPAQELLFSASNFRTAYAEARGWNKKPVPAPAPAPSSNAAPAPSSPEPVEPDTSELSEEPESFEVAANRVVTDLNDIVQDIGSILSDYPNHVESSVLEMLARDIGAAISKAAKASLQIRNGGLKKAA